MKKTILLLLLFITSFLTYGQVKNVDCTNLKTDYVSKSSVLKDKIEVKDSILFDRMTRFLDRAIFAKAVALRDTLWFSDGTHMVTAASGAAINDTGKVNTTGKDTIYGNILFKHTTTFQDTVLFTPSTTTGQTYLLTLDGDTIKKQLMVAVADTGKVNTTVGDSLYGLYRNFGQWLSDANGTSRFGTDAGKVNVGTSNIFIGLSAGLSNTSGYDNVFLGYQSGYTNITTHDNTFLGYSSGRANLANYNTFVGKSSGLTNSTGAYNTFLGTSAGYNNSTGQHNVYVGGAAGQLATGTDNVLIGYTSGISTTGNENTFIGTESGVSNTTGSYNTALGKGAGYSNITGQGVTAIGYKAGYNNLQSTNSFIGNMAGYSSVSGVRNTFIGDSAGYSNTTQSNCTAVGYKAGALHTGGGSAGWTCVGAYAGENNRATRSTFIGMYAGRANTTGDFNVYIGYLTGYNGGVGGAYNTFVGTMTGQQVATPGNTLIGAYAASGNALGAWNTMVGYNTGGASTAANNVFIGSNAGQANTTGTPNTFIGTSSGLYNTSGGQNTALGYQTLYSNTIGSGNTAIGWNAAYSANGATSLTCVGNNAGYAITSGVRNTFMGSSAGQFTTTGGYNTFIGVLSGGVNITGTNNVALGYNSGAYETRSNRLYINNGIQAAGSLGADTTSSLIYGTFASLVANQQLTVNGNLHTKTIYVDSIHYNVKPAMVSAYISTPVNTTATLANTYYFLKGIFTNQYNQSFLLSGDTLVYSNGNNKILTGQYGFVLTVTEASSTVGIAIYVNGTIQSSTQSYTFCRNAGEEYNISYPIFIKVNNGDKIKIMVSSDQSNNTIRAEHGSTYLHETQ